MRCVECGSDRLYLLAVLACPMFWVLRLVIVVVVELAFDYLVIGTKACSDRP